MITSQEARILATASYASYDTDPTVGGYTTVKTFNDPNTGFQAAVFQKPDTGEYIVAFTGTQPQTGQDPVADVALGCTQWNQDNRSEVFNYLQGLDATNISFTGHSLGGALAQYAAYDYLDRTSSPAQVSLATFNGIGGMAGLQQMHPNDFNSNIASEIDAAHFFASSSGQQDLVARLGEGHLGGNTYQIIMDQANAGLGAIHTAWDDFKKLVVPQNTSEPGYLNIPGAQKLADLFTFIGDDGKITNTEGWFRVAGGVILALITTANK